jgi:hypothetical protein
MIISSMGVDISFLHFLGTYLLNLKVPPSYLVHLPAHFIILVLLKCNFFFLKPLRWDCTYSCDLRVRNLMVIFSISFKGPTNDANA